MGYKREIRVRVADILATRQRIIPCGWCEPLQCRHKSLEYKTPKDRVPEFFVMDSSLEKYLTIFLKRSDIPHFIRKAGMFGIIWEKGLCIPVGNASKDWDALQVHIVTNEDCIDIPQSNEKSLDMLDQFKT